MFIEYITTFNHEYENIEKREFLELLQSSNTLEFNEYKLEKDFLLTLILIKFWKIFPDLVFKGWTCLNKVYFPYFRLSEDLDFVINFSGGRVSRKTLLKKYETNISDELTKLWVQSIKTEKLDDYKIARYIYSYDSCIDNSRQTIIFDISLKSPLHLPPYMGKIKSLYKDKILEEDIFWTHSISCIDLREALAEKVRAALTRSTPAIRDFFDIWYVKSHWNFDFSDNIFKELVQIKLQEVEYVYTLENNYDLLEKQIQTDLIPVLHKDYNFSLREIYDFILSFKNSPHAK